MAREFSVFANTVMRIWQICFPLETFLYYCTAR
jgi:hypothetical protein